MGRPLPRPTPIHAPLLLLLLLASVVRSSSSAFWEVGDRSGWSLDRDYSLWARGKTFRRGDILRFNYLPSFHTVARVTKRQYATCSYSKSTRVYRDGRTEVHLTKPGTYYFICTVPGHCEMGMKLKVTVR